MSDLVLTHRLFKIIKTDKDNLELIAQRQAITFPSRKILSPGIRQAVMADVNNFLDMVSGEACKIRDDGVQINQINANELRALAKLVEDGSRIVESTVLTDTDYQTVTIKIKKTS